MRGHYQQRFISWIQGRWGQGLLVLLPVGWMAVFFIWPFLNVFRISFAEKVYNSPPFTAIMEQAGEGILSIRLNFSNYLYIFQDDIYVYAFQQSLLIAGLSTLACVFIAFPMAYALTRTPARWRFLFLILIMIPFWTSFLIRVYAWMGLLSQNGFINNVLLYFNVISQPLTLLNNNLAVCVGITYTYLPFMILPLYTVLSRIDPSLMEAAADLGARRLQTFIKVIIPLSTRGIISGAMLVFIPATGEFVIPELLGGSESLMIGRLLWSEFFYNQNWPVASALAIILLLVLLVPMALLQRLQAREDNKT